MFMFLFRHPVLQKTPKHKCKQLKSIREKCIVDKTKQMECSEDGKKNYRQPKGKSIEIKKEGSKQL
jgi:hypothetical protein